MFLIGAVVFFVFLYFLSTWNHDHFKRRNVKFAKPLPFVGNLKNIFIGKHIISTVVQVYNAFPGERYIGFFNSFVPWIWLRDNELIKKITVTDYESFLDHDVSFLEENDPILANILIGLRGKRWKEMRMIMSPAFTSSKLKSMHPFIKVCADQLTAYIHKQIDLGGKGKLMAEINVKELYTRFATDVIASIVFGLKVDSFKDKTNTFYLMGAKLTNVNLRFFLYYLISNLFPKLAVFLRLTCTDVKAENYFKELLMNTIKEREEKGIRRSDIVDLLIQAKKGYPRGEETSAHPDDKNDLADDVGNIKVWTDEELTAQALIFFLAGYETISTVLSFMSYELATHQDVQKSLIQEVDKTLYKDNLYESIMDMTYMDMVVSECLRLHPTLLGTDRVCTKPYTLPPPNDSVKEGYKLKVGDGVAIQLWAYMRDPRYFPDPNKFDPERFSEENKINIKPFTYIPFGTGPRQCIGKRFSLMEIKSAMFHILSNFELHVVENTIDPFKQKAKPCTMMPDNGIIIGFKRRK